MFLRFILLLAVSVSVSCGSGQPDEPALEDYNLLLIVIDTLGADHIGCYNEELSHTPNIDRLAERGVRFERSYSVAPWTQPSFASILTGWMPSTHGLNQLGAELDTRAETLAELLEDRGYENGAVVSHGFVAAKFGFGRGYGYYDEEPISGHSGVSSHKVTDSALKWLDEHGSGRFHLLLHYFDPHSAYRHHKDFDMTSGYQGPLEPSMDIWELRNQRDGMGEEDIDFLVGLYHEEIAFTDRHIGRVLRYLDQEKLTDKTLIVLTADHGEEFMEHGWIGHTRSVYQELIRVPIIFHLPGVFQEGVVSRTPASQIDILPTLMDFSGRSSSDANWDGTSLLPILRGTASGDEHRELYAEVSFVPRSKQEMVHEKIAFQTTIIRNDLKVIHDELEDDWEGYDLTADPSESRSLASGFGAEMRELSEKLKNWEQARSVQPGTEQEVEIKMTEEEEESLRRLGYLR